MNRREERRRELERLEAELRADAPANRADMLRQREERRRQLEAAEASLNERRMSTKRERAKYYYGRARERKALADKVDPRRRWLVTTLRNESKAALKAAEDILAGREPEPVSFLVLNERVSDVADRAMFRR